MSKLQIEDQEGGHLSGSGKRMKDTESDNGNEQVEKISTNIIDLDQTRIDSNPSENRCENFKMTVSESSSSYKDEIVNTARCQDDTGLAVMELSGSDHETSAYKDRDVQIGPVADQTEVVIASEIIEEALEALTSSVADQNELSSTSRLRAELASSAGVITQQPRPEAAETETETESAVLNHSHDQQVLPPPSYTSVQIQVRRPSLSFIPPVPPPSYGEAMGIEHLTSPRPPPLILNVAPSVWTHRAQPAYCRNCHAVVISKIRHKPCTFTHMAAGLLFLFMCWPFCVLPYCINYCQQARHHCPACNQVLGTYSPVV